MGKYISEENSKFIKRAFALALPITLQGLLNNVLNVVDTIMIGALGETALASVGLANKVFFVYSLLLFGIASGSTVLTAQYWGNKDIPSARKVLGMSLCLSVSSSLVFFIGGAFFPLKVMRIFTPSTDTILSGAGYLSIVAWSYVFQAVSQCYILFQRAINRVKLTVSVTVIAIFINIALNYIFINGKLGFPPMGVKGAALGTLVARCFECVVIVFVIYWNKGPGAARIRELLAFNKNFINRYFRTVTPVVLNEFLWGLGVTLYALAYGRMGNTAVATMTVTQIVEEMFTAAFMGLSSATGVILGNEIGAGRFNDAEKHGRQFLRFNTVFCIILAALLFAVRPAISGLFNITPEITDNVNRTLLVFCLYMPFKMTNLVNIVGVLRSGGDTKYCLFLDFTGVWFIGVPMAFLGGLFFKLPIYYVYAMVLGEEIYKTLLGFFRYKSKKWLRKIVE